jgi:hypothetical protein
MSSPVLAEEQLGHPRTRGAFRAVKVLVGGYLAICVATVVAVVVLRDHRAVVTDAVLVRTTLVTLSALLTAAFTVRAARGSRRGYLRLRIVTGVMVVAIAVIAALPGAFPVWFRIEQAVCGLLLLGVVLIVNGRHLRGLFAGG